MHFQRSKRYHHKRCVRIDKGTRNDSFIESYVFGELQPIKASGRHYADRMAPARYQRTQGSHYTRDTRHQRVPQSSRDPSGYSTHF